MAASRYPPAVESYLPAADVAVPGDYVKMDVAWPLVERFKTRGWPVRFVRPMTSDQFEHQKDYLQLEVWRTQPQFCPDFLRTFLNTFMPGWDLPYEKRPNLPLSERILSKTTW
jgi:hypothetical protein